jgi:MFS family permease
MNDAGSSPFSIGVNTALYYLGIAAASPIVPRLMRRHGRACVTAGLALDALATGLFPFAPGEWAWHGLRLAGGVGTALCIIPMETQVNHDAPKDRRARDFAIYAFCVALGVGVGSGVALPLYSAAPILAFLLGGAATLAALVPGWLGVPGRIEVADAAPGAEVRWWRHAAGFAGAWAQGILEGGCFAFLALYLLSRWGSDWLAGAMMAALFGGVVAAQLPLGWLADRLGRWRVFVGCQVTLIIGLLLIPALPWAVVNGVALLAVGAACGALYPLGLAVLGERLPASALGDANAYYLAANGAGSLMGPLVIGWAVSAAGLPALFYVGALAVGMSALVTLAPRGLAHLEDTKQRCRAA